MANLVKLDAHCAEHKPRSTWPDALLPMFHPLYHSLAIYGVIFAAVHETVSSSQDYVMQKVHDIVSSVVFCPASIYQVHM
jgi:hypothetical protein